MRHSVGRLAGVRSAACNSASVRSGLFVDQRRELVQLRVQDRRPPPGLPAWCELTGFPAPLFQPIHQARLTAYFSATSWTAYRHPNHVTRAAVNPLSTRPSAPPIPQEYHGQVLGTSGICFRDGNEGWTTRTWSETRRT